MALIPSALVKDGNVVGSILPDISSAIGYKETIGSTCVNPDGYTTGKFFVGATDGLFYQATDDIDTGDTITVGTNCEQTDVATVLALLNSDLTALKIKTNSASGTTGGNAILLTDLNVNDIVIVHAHMTGAVINPLEYPSGKYAFVVWGITTAGVFTPTRNAAVTVYYDYIERPSAT